MSLDKILPLEGPSKSEVEKYLKKYTNEVIVIKFGGSVLEEPDLLKTLINDISVLKKLNFNPIIVHGGGKKISAKLRSLNIESEFIEGSRVTTSETIKIIEDVLVELNHKIVSFLDKKSCKAKVFNSKNNNIINVTQESAKLGFVGRPKEIKVNILKNSLKADIVPVVAPLGLDNYDYIYNINADSVAGFIAQKLNARRLIIISDVKGVLDEKLNLISEINSSQVNDLIKKKIISGGMIPKVKNCVDVAINGVKGVVIIDGRKKHSVLFELLSDKGSGTLIRK
tara:strand:- start:923 stop:1771 length:849 start_codon:yes stop_codon:yes gene_type:complete